MSANYKFDPEKVTYLAYTKNRGKEVAFGIKAKDRLQHIYTIGKTGMGKSTLLENMAIQDILNDEGLCFIDPHGSSAERLLKYIPKHRVKDTLYFAPFDTEYPVAFNVMEDVGYDSRHLVVSGLLSALKRIWVGAWSSRMEYILQNTLLALLEYPNTTLLDINRLLTNPEFRQDVVANISDPIVKRFWIEEFANYSDRYAKEATPAIQNKIGQFVSNPLIRNIVGQSRSSFDLREFMDERKILIVNLSKGQLGEQNADLLGSMLTTKIYLEAMARGSQDPENLAPFYMYVDEFQNVVNDSFTDILSEARKYRLSLHLAHQYIEQLDDKIRAAVFGNVGTTISFRVGPQDAEVLETVFSPNVKAEDLTSLGVAEVYMSLLIDSTSSPPFFARTLDAIEDAPYDFSEEIKAESRKQFARARAGVEEFIAEIDRKRGVSRTDRFDKPKDKEKSSELEPEYNETTVVKSKRASGTAIKSPAEILKKELEANKEPNGITGPKELNTKTDNPELKKLIEQSQAEKNKAKKESKSDSEQKANPEISDKSKDPLESVHKDQGAKDSVLERAAKILEKLRKKENPSKLLQEKAESEDGEFKIEEKKEAETVKELDTTRFQEGETQKDKSEPDPEKQEPDSKDEAPELEEATGKNEKSKDELGKKLEEALGKSGHLSDDELRELLESLLYEDKK